MGLDIFLTQFTGILKVGSKRPLLLSDLPELSEELQSESTQAYLLNSSHHVYSKTADQKRCNFMGKPILLFCRVLFRTYRWEFLLLGFLKLLTCLLSFVGPVLLNQIVTLIENDPEREDLPTGLILVGVLFAGLLLQAVVGAQYNVYAALVQTKIRGGLTRAVFLRAMKVPSHVLQSRGITEGEIANMVQIDISKIVDVVPSLHELWSLPLLLVIAFSLLYFQVKIGFLAGVAVIIIMIPINSWIARAIGTATAKLMRHKDLRVTYISDAIRGMKSIKMIGLESIVYDSSLSTRSFEMKYLAVRKYLVQFLLSL